LNMPKYAEFCPLGLTDKEITFTVEESREPSPTEGCICGGTDQEQAMQPVAGAATAANLGNAIVDSILSHGSPVEYKAFKVKGGHNSVIVKIAE